MTQKTSALETCETSSIGRALANMNLSGNKRASREEMEKVARGVKPKNVVVPDGFVDRVNDADLEALKLLWADAVAGGFSVEVQDVVTKRKGALT
jgi:hypothetical protein